MPKQPEPRFNLKISVDLPHIFECVDYHEFSHLQYLLRQIIPGIHVEEVCCAYGAYFGIAYLKKDINFKRLMKELADLSDEYNEDVEDFCAPILLGEIKRKDNRIFCRKV